MSGATMVSPASGAVSLSGTTVSHGPHRPGFLSEAELAARWGRSPNTLNGWRTRPTLSREPIPCECWGIYVYYRIDVIWWYEQQPAHAGVRSVALRGTPFPPLFETEERARLLESIALCTPSASAAVLGAVPSRDVLQAKWASLPFDTRCACLYEGVQYRSWHPETHAAPSGGDHLAAHEAAMDAASDAVVQPELPLAEPSSSIAALECNGMRIEYVPDATPGPRAFASLHRTGASLLALAIDGTAYISDLSDVSLEDVASLTWQQVPPLPPACTPVGGARP